jgi:hypothetical protein
VPFIRYTRDKRGYETTFVMHGYRPAHGPQRTRVLYLFRSPSHIKMGRRPLDEESREALAHTHPDLSFDWTILGRETENFRSEEPRERAPSRSQRHQQAPRPKAPAAPALMPLTIDDQSMLGRTLGGETALRLRARYGELLQRIARRARTPEERDRLTDQAQRLNPDEWSDADAIRTHVTSVEAEWDAVAAELPARRRGRRGGRRRDGRPEDGAGDGADGDSGAPDEATRSDIMAGDGEVDANQDVRESDRPADAADHRVDDRRRGTDDTGPAGDRLPGDDEFRPD